MRPLYLLDEPFANLDPRSKDQMYQLILERTAGKGLMIVHHGDHAFEADFDRVFIPSALTVSLPQTV